MPLNDKDINAPIETTATKHSDKNVKSMEYHRQVLQSKMGDESHQTYISPSDNIMSPCTAKINALRNKHASKAKPKSLFAQASVKKMNDNAASTSDNSKMHDPFRQ